jgi:hypothetical protein
MRTIAGFLLGLAFGAGAMTWFYVNGGEISVAGYELGPPKTATDVAVASPPPAPRVVVRDITESASRSGSSSPNSPAATSSNKTPTNGPGSRPDPAGNSGGKIHVVIKLPH